MLHPYKKTICFKMKLIQAHDDRFEETYNKQRMVPDHIHQDHIYFNVEVKTDSNIGEPARFSVDLSDHIISKANSYHLAVVRFRIPVSDIPFVIFRVEEGLAQSDPNLGRYKFGLRYDNVFYNNNIEFVNNQGYTTPPPAPSENSGLQYFQDGYDYYYIYNTTHFLELWNKTLAQCVDDLLAIVPALAPLEYPYFKVTGQENIDFICPRKFATEGIDVFYNSWLNPYIFGLDVDYIISNPDFEHKINLEIEPQFENGYAPYGQAVVLPPDWLIFRPSFSQIPYWGELQSIILRSVKLPIRSEYTTSNKGFSTVSEPILTDFLISDWNGNRSDIVFIPSGPYRLIDLLSNNSIRSIDLQILWKDVLGRITPLFIYPGTQIEVKLGFIREGLVN